MICTRKYILAMFFMLFFAFCLSAQSNDDIKQDEIEIEADELIYNKDEKLLSANGNVYIKQNDLRLVTDQVVYDKENNYLYAMGNIAFSNDDKNVFFGKKAFFDRNKNTGVMIRFKARLAQKGLLSSDYAQMLNKTTFFVKGLVFSTCAVCKDNFVPNTPLWQIRSKEALLNQQEERIEYRHSKIEIFGLPVFYLPYFSMPTPNARNRSGFLAPKLRNSNVLGFQISTPYYFNIFPQMDLTYTPTFSTRENTLNHLHFRHLIKYGLYDAEIFFIHRDKQLEGESSINNKRSFKGSLKSSGNFEFKNDYFLNYRLNRVFDNSKNFLEKYNISKDDVLTTNISLRREKRDQLWTMDSLSFQDLRKEYDEKKTPYVLPWIRTYNKLPIKLPFNSELLFSSDLVNLKRKEGTSYKRGTFQLDVSNENHLPLGQVLSVNPSMRYDYYNISKTAGTTGTTGTKNRMLGKLFINWKWPFIKQMDNNNIILEPIANFTYNSLTSRNFLKEDSQEQLLNTSNIFSSNFSTGKDIIDLRSRINYGLRANYYTGENIYGAILGQSYKLNQPKELEHSVSYSWNNKIVGQKTEIVGKVYAQIGNNVSFVNNMSLTPNHLNLIKNEFDTSLKYKKFVLSLGHIFIKKQYINTCYNDYNQELSGKLQYNFYQKWWVETKAKRKLGALLKDEKSTECDPVVKEKNKKISKWVSHEIGVAYKGDCLKINFGVERDYSRPKGLKPSVTTYLKIEPVF